MYCALPVVWHPSHTSRREIKWIGQPLWIKSYIFCLSPRAGECAQWHLSVCVLEWQLHCNTSGSSAAGMDACTESRFKIFCPAECEWERGITRVFCSRATRTILLFNPFVSGARTHDNEKYCLVLCGRYWCWVKRGKSASCVSHSDNEVYHRMHKFHFKLHYTRVVFFFVYYGWVSKCQFTPKNIIYSVCIIYPIETIKLIHYEKC